MTILLIDGNSFLWRAVYSQGEQHVAQGVLTYTNEVLERFLPESLVFCWDSGRSRRRSEVYPDYKAHRKAAKDKVDTEEVQKNVELLKRYLTYRGIQQFSVHGVEADDLLSWLSEYIAVYLDKNVTILSADKDLWQLVTPRVTVYDLMRDIRATPDSVPHLMGIPHTAIPDFKAIAGDTSDNIKGVKGLGSKYAVQLLEEYGSIAAMRDPQAVTELMRSKKFAKLFTEEDKLDCDMFLTRIPKLADFPWYTNEAERQEFQRCLVTPVENQVNARVLSDALGKALVMYKPCAPVDFSGFPLEPQNSLVYNSWNALDTAVASCSKCPLRGDCREYGPTLAQGYTDVDIMIVGRNPGETELTTGKPFVGPSGDLVDEFLQACGLTRRDVYITNVCKCYSQGNRGVTPHEVGTCSQYLQAEINLLAPKFILAFGNEAMALLTDYKYGVLAHSGEIVKPVSPQVSHGAQVAICVHPSAALRHPKNRANFDYCVKMVSSFLDKRRGTARG